MCGTVRLHSVFIALTLWVSHLSVFFKQQISGAKTICKKGEKRRGEHKHLVLNNIPTYSTSNCVLRDTTIHSPFSKYSMFLT